MFGIIAALAVAGIFMLAGPASIVTSGSADAPGCPCDG